jgi:ATP dependent DNA ligase domain
MTGAAPLGLDSGNAASIFAPMSVSNELRRRLRAEQSRPRFEPCLPRPAKEPPAGLGWIHEIKHDGFRILARRDQGDVRLLTRNGNDFTEHFPHIAEAIRALNVRSCVIDGEAIVTDDRGLAVFELIRGHDTRRGAELCAFDLIELDGKDIRHTRSKNANVTWVSSLAGISQALSSMSSSRATPKSFSTTLASWVARASCRNGLARPTARGDRRIGSRSRIQPRRR